MPISQMGTQCRCSTDLISITSRLLSSYLSFHSETSRSLVMIWECGGGGEERGQLQMGKVTSRQAAYRDEETGNKGAPQTSQGKPQLHLGSFPQPVREGASSQGPRRASEGSTVFLLNRMRLRKPLNHGMQEDWSGLPPTSPVGSGAESVSENLALRWRWGPVHL